MIFELTLDAIHNVVRCTRCGCVFYKFDATFGEDVKINGDELVEYKIICPACKDVAETYVGN